MILEKERDALMGLTMCARHDCPNCKYKSKNTFWDCQRKITDYMYILYDALERIENEDNN